MQHAEYLNNWLGVLKADKRAILSPLRLPLRKAHEYLKSLQPGAAEAQPQTDDAASEAAE